MLQAILLIAILAGVDDRSMSTEASPIRPAALDLAIVRHGGGG